MVSALAYGSSGPPRALAGGIVLSSWVRRFTLTVTRSNPGVKMCSGELNAGGNLAMD